VYIMQKGKDVIAVVSPSWAPYGVAEIFIVVGLTCASFCLFIAWGDKSFDPDIYLVGSIALILIGVVKLFGSGIRKADGLFGHPRNMLNGKCALDLQNKRSIRSGNFIAVHADKATPFVLPQGAEFHIRCVEEGVVKENILCVSMKGAVPICFVKDGFCHSLSGRTGEVRNWMVMLDDIIGKAFPDIHIRKRLLLKIKKADTFSHGLALGAIVGTVFGVIGDSLNRKAAIRRVAGGELPAYAEELNWDIDVCY
jgi:hypothetical protein